ncbi:MAG TPA: glycerophosphodiester phosphodiesterase family protein, partial [Deinococcales bacterium]|nr:glycerophosphodiester phosphodiesterase family protein [Deinococcales bacterium]
MSHRSQSRPARWPRVLLVLAVLVVSLWLIAPVFGEPRPEHPYYSLLPDRGVHVLAHAGGIGLWPDNTMTAFEGSRGLGADVLELDIQLSSDAELVVIHDDTVDRTTDGSGPVDGFTLQELQELDAAAQWAGPDGDYPYRGSGVYIPSLREVLEEFRDIPVNIELKSTDPLMAELTCSLVQELDRELSVLVASFHQEQLHYFRELCPEVATSAGPDEVATFVVLNLLGLG